MSVIGVRQNINTDLASMIATVRKVNPTLPVAIGFGIATSKPDKKMSQLADGVIIGSAIVQQIANYQQQAPHHLAKYAQEICQAIR